MNQDEKIKKNFAVRTSEDEIERGNKILSQLGESKVSH